MTLTVGSIIGSQAPALRSRSSCKHSSAADTAAKSVWLGRTLLKLAEPPDAEVKGPALAPIESHKIRRACDVVHYVRISAVGNIIESAAQRPHLAPEPESPLEVKIQLKMRGEPR